MVRIYSIVIQTIKKFAALAKVNLKIVEKRKVSFPMFSARFSSLKKGFFGKCYALVTDEVEQFNKLEVLEKISVETGIIKPATGVFDFTAEVIAFNYPRQISEILEKDGSLFCKSTS